MSEKPKKGNGSNKVIIVLLLLIVVGGAAFGGMYFFGNKSATTTATAAKTDVVTEVTYSLDEFIVNLLDDGGLLYLKTTVFIGHEENANLATELETKKPIIRDIVNTYLRSKKNADFTSAGIVTVKSDLLNRINPILTKGKASNIYINNIVISR